MEEKVVPTFVDHIPTSRRSRKDEQGRDFQCGCGKRYLSYPALYTHIKTKHDGKQPEGTLKSGIAQVARKIKVKLDDDTLKIIQGYFKQENFKVFEYIPEGINGHTSNTSRIKKEAVNKQIYECYLNMIKEKQVKLTSSSPLELALAVYLLNVGEYVNDKFFQQYVLFARIAMGAYYDHGEEIYNMFFVQSNGPFTLKTFNLNQVAYFPLVADFISQLYIPTCYHKQGKEANLSLMELLTYEFCGWLYSQKLTSIKTTFCQQIKIDFKPVIKKNTPSKIDSIKQADREEAGQGDQEYEDISQNEPIEEDQDAKLASKEQL